MKSRYQTAIGRVVAHWQIDDAQSTPDCEIIRPKNAQHSAMETYALASCVTALGFFVCQDLLGRAFEMTGILRFIAATLLTTFFLQVLAILFLPAGRLMGALLLIALTLYLLIFQTLDPVTILWLVLCGFNFFCWLIQRISSFE